MASLLQCYSIWYYKVMIVLKHCNSQLLFIVIDRLKLNIFLKDICFRKSNLLEILYEVSNRVELIL